MSSSTPILPHADPYGSALPFCRPIGAGNQLFALARCANKKNIGLLPQLPRKSMVSLAHPRTVPQRGAEIRSSPLSTPAASGVPKIFLDQAEVTIATTMSRSAIYEAMQEKRFPTPVRLSARRVAWRASDVLAWCESRTKTDASSAGGEA